MMEQSQQQLAITIKKSPEHNSQGALTQMPTMHTQRAAQQN